MNQRVGETATRRRSSISRAQRTLECGDLTPLSVTERDEVEIKSKVRDREDALAPAGAGRDACAAQKTLQLFNASTSL
jgi:hypothetical protein